MSIRKKLIKSVNKTIDKFDFLSAAHIADGIIEDTQIVELVEQLESIADGSAFDKESGIIWEHRLEKIKELLGKLN